MKVVVTSSGKGLDAPVDQRFGRCPFFVIVDTGTGEYEDAPNGSAAASGGAGIAAAQQVAAKNPEAVLTGHCGPNAFNVLKASKIGVYTGITGSVRDAVAAFKAGTLQNISGPDAESHTGMGR